jgi:hypothetical protein
LDHPCIQPLQSASSFNTPKKEPLFLPDGDIAEPDLFKISNVVHSNVRCPLILMWLCKMNFCLAQTTHPKHIHDQNSLPLTSRTDSDISFGLTPTPTGFVQSSGAAQVDFALSQSVSVQPLTHNKHQTPQIINQSDSYSPFSSLPLEPSVPDSHSAAESQAADIPQSFAILSSLRHIAAQHSHVVGTFEEQIRELFIRENAPSPEPRDHVSPEPTQTVPPSPETEVHPQLVGSKCNSVEKDEMFPVGRAVVYPRFHTHKST